MGKQFVTFTDPTGGQAVLTVDVASQNFNYGGAHWQTDPSDRLEFEIDNAIVIGTVLPTNNTNFQTYQFVFDTGAPGTPHTFEIRHVSATPGQNHIGFAIDTLHINDWTTDPTNLPPPPPPPPPAVLFSEIFDNLSPQFGADLAQHGWFNVNNGGKTTVNLFQNFAAVDFYLNTRDTDGLELLIGHAFTDPTAGKAMLSFDFRTQPGMNTQDSLVVMVDGISFASNVVASYPGTGPANEWQHVDIPINTGSTPNATHTFYINEHGNPPMILGTGFAVDNIQIHDLII